MEEHEFETMQPMAEQDADNEAATVPEPEESPLGVPFGWFGITLLLNILQYTVLLGLTMVVLIILRMFMPANMPNP